MSVCVDFHKFFFIPSPFSFISPLYRECILDFPGFSSIMKL